VIPVVTALWLSPARIKFFLGSFPSFLIPNLSTSLSKLSSSFHLAPSLSPPGTDDVAGGGEEEIKNLEIWV